MTKCPICKSNSPAKLGEIAQSVLANYYIDTLAVDTSHLLKRGGPSIVLLHCQECDLRWYAPAPSGDPVFYEGLQKHPWYYQDDKPEYSFASTYLTSGTMLLEIGCGKGAFASFLPPGVVYRGLEFNQEAVAKGRALGLKIDVETVEAHAIQSHGIYDVVCHFQVLEHVTDPLPFLQACVTLLKPGGLLIVAVPSEDSFLSIVEGGFLNMPPHHVTRWSDKALGLAIERVGLQPKEYWHEPVASYHRHWYRSVLGLFALRRFLGQKTRIYANDLLTRLMRRLVRSKKIGDSLSRVGETHFMYRARGHTVCVVGRKGGATT